MLSIRRMTTVDPVGIVHAVFAAFEDVGRVTRSVLDNNRGSESFARAAVVVGVAGDVDVVVAGGAVAVEGAAAVDVVVDDEEEVDAEDVALFCSPN
jgi:hypothetical protein